MPNDGSGVEEGNCGRTSPGFGMAPFRFRAFAFRAVLDFVVWDFAPFGSRRVGIRHAIRGDVSVSPSTAFWDSALFGIQRCSEFSALWNSARKSTPPVRNPPWYGFNLLEYFSTDPDWMKYFPYKNDGMLLEDDFRWIRDWGFNWVRLPMDYRFWTAPDLFTINEKQIEPVDRAIRLQEIWNPRERVSPSCAGLMHSRHDRHETSRAWGSRPQKTDVFTDQHTFDAFVHQWTFFADRYKGIPSQRLSFNLVNEPIVLPNAAELAELQKHRPVKTADLFSPERLQRHAKDYTRLAKATADAIRVHDPERLVVSDGYPGGGFADSRSLRHGDAAKLPDPIRVSRHNCEWARGILTGSEPVPTWPLKDDKGKVSCDRQTLERTFHPWADLPAQGVPIISARWAVTSTLHLTLCWRGLPTHSTCWPH